MIFYNKINKIIMIYSSIITVKTCSTTKTSSLRSINIKTITHKVQEIFI